MDRREESKVEGSIPVQARVNIKCLADLDAYWSSEGYQIRSMSQLIGFSVELLCEILEANQKFGWRSQSISEANAYLTERGLHQQSMKNRSFKKIGMAVTFENMRENGADPRIHAPQMYNTMHKKFDRFGNPVSVQPFMGRAESPIVKEAMEIMNNLPETNHSILNELSGLQDKQEIKAPVSVVEEQSQECDKEIVSEYKELPPMRERGNDPEIMKAHIKAADEKSMAQMDALKNLDLNELMAKAKKE